MKIDRRTRVAAATVARLGGTATVRWMMLRSRREYPTAAHAELALQALLDRALVDFWHSDGGVAGRPTTWYRLTPWGWQLAEVLCRDGSRSLFEQFSLTGG